MMALASGTEPSKRLTLSELFRELCKTPVIQNGWPVILALALLYGPSYNDLAHGPWTNSQESHGPFIIIASLWIVSKLWPDLMALERKPALIAGYIALLVGGFLYVIGRSQSLLAIEIFSQIPVLTSLILFSVGWAGVRLLWFPLLFLMFIVPMPGWIMDSLTAPLKRNVSDIVAHTLSGFGYPVAQNGVVLYIAQYQLLVADACSGINSLYSLSAVGLFYIYMAKAMHGLNKIVLLLLTVPVAFCANVLRVFVLVLITYYFGDRIAQSFIHDFSGLFLFIMSLTLLFLIDIGLYYVMKSYAKTTKSATS